jgi:hypothetical protein
MPRSVDRFNSSIQQFQRTRTQGEKAGRVSQKEMQQALTELTDANGNVSRANLKAAKDLFNSANIDMTRGGRELLKGFIEQNSPSSATQGGGVRTMQSVAEMQAYLRDPGALDGIFQSAFGHHALSRSASREVGSVKQLANGNFEVDVKLVHWRTRAEMGAGTVELNGAGSVVDSNVTTPQDPRDAKITADGPIGPLGGGGGRVFKVRADDPVPGGPSVPDDAPPDPRDVKITADGPIGGGGRVFKVRADDPIPPYDGDPVPPQPPPRDDGDIVKVRADDPIPDITDDDSAPDPIPPQPPPRRDGPIGGGRVFKITADDPI